MQHASWRVHKIAANGENPNVKVHQSEPRPSGSECGTRTRRSSAPLRSRLRLVLHFRSHTHIPFNNTRLSGNLIKWNRDENFFHFVDGAAGSGSPLLWKLLLLPADAAGRSLASAAAQLLSRPATGLRKLPRARHAAFRQSRWRRATGRSSGGCRTHRAPNLDGSCQGSLPCSGPRRARAARHPLPPHLSLSSDLDLSESQPRAPEAVKKPVGRRKRLPHKSASPCAAMCITRPETR